MDIGYAVTFYVLGASFVLGFMWTRFLERTFSNFLINAAICAFSVLSVYIIVEHSVSMMMAGVMTVILLIGLFSLGVCVRIGGSWILRVAGPNP